MSTQGFTAIPEGMPWFVGLIRSPVSCPIQQSKRSHYPSRTRHRPLQPRGQQLLPHPGSVAALTSVISEEHSPERSHNGCHHQVHIVRALHLPGAVVAAVVAAVAAAAEAQIIRRLVSWKHERRTGVCR